MAGGLHVRELCVAVRVDARRCDAAQHGFTYVGLLITLAIMTSALAIVAPVWEVASRRDKEAELLFIGGEFQRALAGYAKFGTSTADRYDWAVVRPPEGGGIVGVHSKSEKEPIKQSNFPASQKDFEGKTKYAEWVFFDQPRSAAIPPGGVQTPQAGNQAGGLQSPPPTPHPGSIVQPASPLRPGGTAQQSVGGVPQTTR
ncbi:MAG: type secretory pathway, pseudopilin PulG [Proteobacteria bacterium]|nr:type secretory pathway, pseudopilin PulG [Pseudomonadota bacterium]